MFLFFFFCPFAPRQIARVLWARRERVYHSAADSRQGTFGIPPVRLYIYIIILNIYACVSIIIYIHIFFFVLRQVCACGVSACVIFWLLSSAVTIYIYHDWGGYFENNYGNTPPERLVIQPVPRVHSTCACDYYTHTRIHLCRYNICKNINQFTSNTERQQQKKKYQTITIHFSFELGFCFLWLSKIGIPTFPRPV